MQQQAGRSLRGELDERSGQFGEQLGSTASDIRQIAGQLRQQDNDGAARIADLAAEQIERAASYLSSTSGDALLEDVERLARSKPWLATGAAALTGFVASRALSASRRERHGGGYVDLDAGSAFDEADADAAYPDEPAFARSRS